MATLPAEGRWSIRNVGDDDVPAALAFLRRDPLINVYLISRLMEERFATATQMVEIRYNRETVLMASLATNIVLASDPGAAHEIAAAATGARCCARSAATWRGAGGSSRSSSTTSIVPPSRCTRPSASSASA